MIVASFLRFGILTWRMTITITETFNQQSTAISFPLSSAALASAATTTLTTHNNHISSNDAVATTTTTTTTSAAKTTMTATRTTATTITDSRIHNQPSFVFCILSLTAITSEAAMVLNTKIALTVMTPHEQQHEQRSHLQRRRRW